jgi:oxygen-independent coproporphyrinogen III oxidase
MTFHSTHGTLAIEPAWQPARSAYVHIPFCRHRCGYCDFTLIAGRDDLTHAFLDSLETELWLHQADQHHPVSELDTLFLGGGTPTHLSSDALQRLFALLQRRFRWTAAAEVSVEANPLDLTDERLHTLQAAGVNRLSLGVQSFDPDVLRLLERDHQPHEIVSLLQRLQPHWKNLSLDLIFAVPNQSLSSWADSLSAAIDSGVPHLSTYNLTFESGTAFFTRQRRGELQPLDDARQAEMFELAITRLEAAGYEHYETSNFALPGYRCRHNQVYWRGEEYWAYGPGAARYLQGQRETNVRSVLGWLARLQRGQSPTQDVDRLDDEGRARERLYLAIRMADGIDCAQFQRQTGWTVEQLFGPALQRHQDAGWLTTVDGRLRLTRAGRFFADRIAVDCL